MTCQSREKYYDNHHCGALESPAFSDSIFAPLSEPWGVDPFCCSSPDSDVEGLCVPFVNVAPTGRVTFTVIGLVIVLPTPMPIIRAPSRIHTNPGEFVDSVLFHIF